MDMHIFCGAGILQKGHVKRSSQWLHWQFWQQLQYLHGPLVVFWNPRRELHFWNCRLALKGTKLNRNSTALPPSIGEAISSIGGNADADKIASSNTDQILSGCNLSAYMFVANYRNFFYQCSVPNTISCISKVHRKIITIKLLLSPAGSLKSLKHNTIPKTSSSAAPGHAVTVHMAKPQALYLRNRQTCGRSFS